MRRGCYTSGGSKGWGRTTAQSLALASQGIFCCPRWAAEGCTRMESTIARGLRNVVLDTTQSSFIDGEAGVLLYRGYSIPDLARRSNFEEVCYLLLYGALPTRTQLDDLRRRLLSHA